MDCEYWYMFQLPLLRDATLLAALTYASCARSTLCIMGGGGAAL